jgi:hypothetical protein
MVPKLKRPEIAPHPGKQVSKRTTPVNFDLRNAEVRLTKQLEDEIRKQCSEDVVLEVHDRLYVPLRDAFDPIRAAVEDELASVFGAIGDALPPALPAIHEAAEAAVTEALGAPSGSAPAGPHRRALQRKAIARIRSLLDRKAKERDLQRALVESGLLTPAGICRAVQEVTMAPTGDHPRGMRMDLVVGRARKGPAEVIELKRGSHRLLAYRGAPTERIAKPLQRALAQVGSYGRRLRADARTRAEICRRYDLGLDTLELRLVAGRRLPNAHAYHLLSDAEGSNGREFEVCVSTWDGFLAELERIADG